MKQKHEEVPVTIRFPAEVHAQAVAAKGEDDAHSLNSEIVALLKLGLAVRERQRRILDHHISEVASEQRQTA